jgi:hypothetical protein
MTMAEILIGQNLYLNRARCPESSLIQGTHYIWEAPHRSRDDSEDIQSGRFSKDITACGRLTALVPLLVSLSSVWGPGEMGGHEIAHLRTARKGAGYPMLVSEAEGCDVIAAPKDWGINRMALKTARVPEQMVLRSHLNAVVYEDEIVTPAYANATRHLPFWFVVEKEILKTARTSGRFAWTLERMMKNGKAAAFTPRGVKIQVATFGELVVEYTNDARITKMYLSGEPRANVRMGNGVTLIAGDTIPQGVRGYFKLNQGLTVPTEVPMSENNVGRAMPDFEAKTETPAGMEIASRKSMPKVERREKAPRPADVAAEAPKEAAQEPEHVSAGSVIPEGVEVISVDSISAAEEEALADGIAEMIKMDEELEAVIAEAPEDAPAMAEDEQARILAEAEAAMGEFDAAIDGADPRMGSMSINGGPAVSMPLPGHQDHRSLEDFERMTGSTVGAFIEDCNTPSEFRRNNPRATH